LPVWLLAVLVGVTAVATASAESTRSPEVSLERLKAGNARFVANPASMLPITFATRDAQAKGQAPWATVLSCADSRVPVEVVFNVGLGDLFVVRTAGQVADKAVLASVEYGAQHLGVPLVLVLGHESCGAVKAAIDATPGSPSMGPNLDALVAAIKPSFRRLGAAASAPPMKDAVLANVDEIAASLLAQSEILRGLASQKKLLVVGGYYELETGEVHLREPAPGGTGSR